MNPDALRKARLWLALVFLVGAAIGAVFGYSFGYRSYAATLASQQQPMSEAERRAKRLADMTKEVDLTPEQTAKMDDIIKNAHASIKSIRDKSEASIKSVIPTDPHYPAPKCSPTLAIRLRSVGPGSK